MDKQLINLLTWIGTGIAITPNSIMENYYYDMKNNEFFPISFLDYGLSDKNEKLRQDIITDSDDQKKIAIINRIKRIERKDPNIIEIPRIPLEERYNLLSKFIFTLDDKDVASSIRQNYIDSKNEIFEQHYRIEINEEIDERWQYFKWEDLREKTIAFLQSYNIDIHNSSLFDDSGTTSITFDLT